MLVRLYDLPDEVDLRRRLARQDTEVRRAMAYEKDIVARWVDAVFGECASGWRSECEVAFARSPLACHIAVCDTAMVGFACYDSTCKNFLGPIGVAADRRGAGIGKLLLITTLQAMRAEGYGYAIIGQVGAPAFFSSAVGAVEIPGSASGIYPQHLEA
jgi:GNAT superfamily N-acetyltransferase